MFESIVDKIKKGWMILVRSLKFDGIKIIVQHV